MLINSHIHIIIEKNYRRVKFGRLCVAQNFLGENAKVRARVTYLDDDLRIVRNEKDGQVFAYIKA